MAQGLSTPQVSVVMSVYNGAAYLQAALDSILHQSFRDFELLVIDDGSTDGTAAILQACADQRLQVITQANQGLVASLNHGIELAKAEIIARHDADDQSEPERFAQQYAALQADPKVVLIGSSMAVMDTAGKRLHTHYVLLNDAELKQELLIRSPFAHGSTMFRKQAVAAAGGYRQTDWPAEDYGLWLRLAAQGAFMNLDAPLYVYRENRAGISLQNQTAQAAAVDRLQSTAWQQRQHLLPRRIRVAAYAKLPMGQFRIERITHNLLFGLRKSVRHGSLGTFRSSLRLLLSDKAITRKCARLVLIRLGLKHG